MRSSTDKINQKINQSQKIVNSQHSQSSSQHLQSSQNNNNNKGTIPLEQQSTIFQPIVIDNDYITKQPSRPLNNSGLRGQAAGRGPAKENALQATQERAPPPDLNQSMTDSFIMMNRNKTPIKHRPKSDYVIIKENPSKSFHKTDQIKKAITDKLINWTRFFKYNPINSLMSELEAVCCSFFRLIAPNHAPSGRAHTDADKNYIGFSSKEMPEGFKSLKEDPLKEEDLEIKCLENGSYTIPELDEIDAKIARYRKAALLRYYKDKKPEDRDQYDLEKMIKNKLGDQVIWEDKKKNRFVTVKDLRNYRITKGLGIGLTTSFILGEDDCHRGNISKYGVRIDFDMTLWWLLCLYKLISLIDWGFRFPDANTFAVHADDIKSFPNLTHADPFYWPGKRKSFLTSRLGKVLADSILAKKLSSSTNGYRDEDHAVFEKLEKHAVFNYHKNATLLKFILTEGEMYRNLAKLHIREQVIIDNKVVPILDVLTQTMTQRIDEFRKVLMDMPEFYEFFNTVDKALDKTYGEIILKDINAQFTERNNHYEEREKVYPEYKEQVRPINLFENQYNNFFKEAERLHGKVYIDPHVEEFAMINDEAITATLETMRPTIKT